MRRILLAEFAKGETGADGFLGACIRRGRVAVQEAGSLFVAEWLVIGYSFVIASLFLAKHFACQRLAAEFDQPLVGEVVDPGLLVQCESFVGLFPLFIEIECVLEGETGEMGCGVFGVLIAGYGGFGELARGLSRRLRSYGLGNWLLASHRRAKQRHPTCQHRKNDAFCHGIDDSRKCDWRLTGRKLQVYLSNSQKIN